MNRFQLSRENEREARERSSLLHHSNFDVALTSKVKTLFQDDLCE